MPLQYTSAHVDQLNRKVDSSGGPDACWPWLGWKDKRGYGYKQLGYRKRIFAHRMAWMVVNGEIPEGMNVLHSCDNPSCCNPAHLSLGTHADNVADCVRKGRHSKGKRIRDGLPACAKITPKDVVEIRSLVASGCRTMDVAKQYGLRPCTITNIVKRKRWRSVP
jgi:hypothetical protein